MSFRYTVSPYLTDDRYRYRVYMRAIDPAGNSPIKKALPPGEPESKRVSRYIKKEFYIKAKDTRKLLPIIKTEAQRLYNENLDHFASRLKIYDFAATAPITFFGVYRDPFLDYLGINSKAVRTQYASQLKGMCSILPTKPMRDFTRNDISKLYRKIMTRDKRRRLVLLKKFWDFYSATTHSDFINPVEDFIKDLPRKQRQNTKSLISKASQLLRLSFSQEKDVLSMVEEKLDEDMSIAILLMNGAGLPMAEILKLSWKDIQVCKDSGTVTVLLSLDKSGATRDRRRPMFSAEAALVIKKFEMIKASGENLDLSQLPLIEMPQTSNAQKKRRKAISQAMRNLLISCLGASALSPSKFSEPNIGTATSLLLSNYEAKLLLCGAEGDSGLMDYLLCRKISSTTADHYRSFSSPSGQRYIQCIIDRYDSKNAFSSKKLKPNRCVVKSTKATHSYYVKHTGLGYFGQFQGCIFLRKGEQLSVHSGKGAQVIITQADDETKQLLSELADKTLVGVQQSMFQ